MIRIGLIGFGHWGPNHLRAFSSIKGVRVVAACDAQQVRRDAIGETYPHVLATEWPEEVIRHPEVDAVVVASPTITHFEFTKQSLEAGKDVLCEKPLAILPDECEQLCEIADRMNRILMVGHIYLYNDGICQIKRAVDDGELGPIRYAYSVRSNNGPVRNDVSVIYDLASHDVSVMNYLLDSTPTEISVSGISVGRKRHHDAAFMTLRYFDDVLVNIHVSWIGMKKIRQMSVVGATRTAEWDELCDLGSVRIIERARVGEPTYRDFGEFQMVSREKDLKIQRVQPVEPLREQAEHFIDCVRTRQQPFCDGRRATDVVRTLYATQCILDRSLTLA
jgi:predicted dehydrogenase